MTQPGLSRIPRFQTTTNTLNKAVGYALSPKHFRALLINKQGTRAYDRKLQPSK